MQNTTIILLLITSLFSIGCKQVKEPTACGPIPTKAQLDWHALEYYAFVHFNMNTFTDEEWGYGSENPASFNPSNLDCKQWVKVFKESGMKAVIITAKHHDGFCLWPTKTTEHSIKNSPYKNGDGDILKELSLACKEAGLKFGVYLSPWDRNSEHYGKPEYITIFREQLRELMTEYGEIFEVWFDGANGGSGYYGGAKEDRKIDRKTYYDWDKTYQIIRELQPQACIFGDGGPEVRWVGNEEGWAGETNWSIIKHEECYAGMPNYKELSYGHENGTKWVPAECDVSIRPGWYYHKREDHRVKSLVEMVDIYYNSIGRNASLLLNFPVDHRGLVHEIDAQRAIELAAIIKKDFEDNLIKDANIKATNTRGSTAFTANNIKDGNIATYWTSNDKVTGASMLIELPETRSFNRFIVQEYITLGQRVQRFKLEAFINNSWELIDEQSTIGAKRILRFPTVTTNKIKFSITKSKACPCISEIGLYHAPKLLIQPEITRNQNGIIHISKADKETDIFYTIDGSIPDTTSQHYIKGFKIDSKVTIKAIAIDIESKLKSEITTKYFDISPNKWKVQNLPKHEANKLLDGDINTSVSIKNKHLIIDCGENLSIKGFSYLPDQSRWGGNYIFTYAFYVSTDGINWGAPVSSGEFSNIENSPITQEKFFGTKEGRFIKLTPLSTVRGKEAFSIAEFTLITN